MTVTSSRTLQWIIIILILTAIAGGVYHYLNVRAAKINAPQTTLNTSGLVGYWTFDGKDMRNGVVHKVDIEKFDVIKDIPTAPGAHGIAYSFDGKIAYVTNTWDNSLSVMNLEADSIIKKIEVGLKPNGVAVSNGKNQGW